jgi:hypothetical protein
MAKKTTQNEEDTVIKNKQGECLVVGLIHTLSFNTFVFFMALLCYLFAFKTQIVNITINLAHS